VGQIRASKWAKSEYRNHAKRQQELTLDEFLRDMCRREQAAALILAAPKDMAATWR